jgi:hypothetical protein
LLTAGQVKILKAPSSSAYSIAVVMIILPEQMALWDKVVTHFPSDLFDGAIDAGALDFGRGFPSGPVKIGFPSGPVGIGQLVTPKPPFTASRRMVLYSGA